MIFSDLRFILRMSLLGGVLFFFVACAGEGNIQLDGAVWTQESVELRTVNNDDKLTTMLAENGARIGVHSELIIEEEVDSASDSETQHRFYTDDSGSFTVKFIPEKFPDANLLITFQSTNFPFQKIIRGVKIKKGKMINPSMKIYMASTIISGRILSTSGKPLSGVDILAWRDTQKDINKPTYVPYSFHGAQLVHGIYSDDLGYFSIPVQFPDAKFEIKVGTLQPELFGSKSLNLNVESNRDNPLGDISIVSKILDDREEGGGGTSVSLSNNVMPILRSNCDCHTGGGAPLGVNLNSSTTIIKTVVDIESFLVKGMLRVKPFDSGGSFLYEKIVSTPRAAGRMPLQRAPLKPSEIEIIRKWIDEGANNN